MYTYLVKSRTTKLFYYGVKYAKNAKSEDFWKNYFTSSKYVHDLIERYGKDDFDVQIRKEFDTQESALKWEQKVIRRIRHWDNCLNISLGGDAVKSHKNRNIVGADGFNSYQRAGLRMSKTLNENPHILKDRSLKRSETMFIIDDNGLNGYQKQGLKISGENNSSKRPEVKSKISNTVNDWVKNNQDKVKENIQKSKDAMMEKGEDGLNHHERHSLYMKENNPTSGTIWVNDGLSNKRIKFDEEIPNGFVKGRLKKDTLKGYKYEVIECPHCGKQGKGGNMTRYHFDNCKKAVNVQD